MKKLLVNTFILLIVLLLPMAILIAQPLQTQYYNAEWEPCSQQGATYYRQIRYDSLGKPKGEVRDYYMNGRLQWIGKLLVDEPDDVLDSTCTWFNEEGEITKQSTYVNGLLHGLYFMVHIGGYQDSGYYIAGKKQGLWKSFNAHGTLIRRVTYTEDKLNGLWEEFHEDGLLLERCVYVNGQRHGASKQYKNGRLLALIHYKHGLEEGVCKSYNDYGLLLDSSYYIHGLISGCRVSYDQYSYPPRKKEEWDYVNGQVEKHYRYEAKGSFVLKESTYAEMLREKEEKHDHADNARDSVYSQNDLLYKYWSWYGNGQLKEHKEYSRTNHEDRHFFINRHDFYNESGDTWATLAWDTLGLYIHKDYDNCLYGLKNKKRQWVVKPIYSSINETAEGFIAFLSGKAAFLSRSGKQVLPPLFDDCLLLVNPRYPYVKESHDMGLKESYNRGPFKRPDQFYQLSRLDTFCYLKVRVGQRYGLYSISGRMLYDAIYNQIEWDWSHSLKLSRTGQTEYVYGNGTKVSLPFNWVERIKHTEDFFVYADKEGDYQNKVGLLHRSGKALSGLDYHRFRGLTHGWFMFESFTDNNSICLLDSNGVERHCIAEEDMQLIQEPFKLMIIRGQNHLYQLCDSNLKPLLDKSFNNVILQDSALVLEENGKKGFYDLWSRRFFPCVYEKLYVPPGQSTLLAQEGNTLQILDRQSGLIRSMKNTRCLYADTYLFFLAQGDRVSGYTTNTQTPVPSEILFPDSLNELSTSDEVFWIDHTGRILYGGGAGRLEKVATNLYKWSNAAGQAAWIRRDGTFVLPFGPYMQLNTENTSYYQISTGVGRQGLLERNGKMLLDTLYAAISHPFSHDTNRYCWVVLYERLTPGIYLQGQEDPDLENFQEEYSYPYEGLWQLYNINTQKLSDSVFQFPYTFSSRGYVSINEEGDLFNLLDISGQLLFPKPIEDWIEAGTQSYYKQGGKWYRYRGKNQTAELLPYDLMKDAGLCSDKRHIYVEKKGWANLLNEQGQALLSTGEERISRLMVFKDYSCSFSEREIFVDNEQSLTLFRSLPLFTRLYLDSVIYKELEQESSELSTIKSWIETKQIFGMQDVQESYNLGAFSREESTSLRFNLEQSATHTYALWVKVWNISTASRGPGSYHAHTYCLNFYLYKGRLYSASLPRLFKVNDAFKALVFKQAHRYMDKYEIPEEECNTPHRLYTKIKDNFTIGKNGITFFLNPLLEQNEWEQDPQLEQLELAFTISYEMLKPWILSVPLLTAIR